MCITSLIYHTWRQPEQCQVSRKSIKNSQHKGDWQKGWYDEHHMQCAVSNYPQCEVSRARGVTVDAFARSDCNWWLRFWFHWLVEVVNWLRYGGFTIMIGHLFSAIHLLASRTFRLHGRWCHWKWISSDRCSIRSLWQFRRWAYNHRKWSDGLYNNI